MIASLDGFFDDGYLLEIKNLATQKHLEIITSGSKSKEFRYYYWQVQHQLLVSGAPGAFLLFWSSKETPKTFLIKPNHEIHAKLIDASKKFYDCVKDRVAPPFDDEKDVLLISDAEIMKQTKGFSIPSDLDVRIAKIRSNVIELEKAKAEVNRLEALTKADISGLSVALGFKQGKPVRGRINYSSFNSVLTAAIISACSSELKRCQTLLTTGAFSPSVSGVMKDQSFLYRLPVISSVTSARVSTVQKLRIFGISVPGCTGSDAWLSLLPEFIVPPINSFS